MFSFIPPFMRNSSFAALGAMTFGTVVYTVAKQRADRKLAHPLVKETVLLLQNNDDVVQLIGVPILVDPAITARASVADDVSNFSFKVRGPRGKLVVELAGLSAQLRELGPNERGREALKKEPEAQGGGATGLTAHAEAFNYNDFYVPDRSIIEDYFDLSGGVTEQDSLKQLAESDKFWKYEYVYAEVDKDTRILIAPNERLAKEQEPVLSRATLADLKREYKARMKTYRVMDGSMTKEEKEEFRKIRHQEHFRKIGYVRTYLMVSICVLSMQAYVLFRKKKRLPITQSSLHVHLTNALLKSPEFKVAVGGSRLYFNETSVGAIIDNRAEYSFQFAGSEKAGLVHFCGKFEEKTGQWTVEHLEAEIFEDNLGEKTLKVPIQVDLTM